MKPDDLLDGLTYLAVIVGSWIVIRIVSPLVPRVAIFMCGRFPECLFHRPLC